MTAPPRCSSSRTSGVAVVDPAEAVDHIADYDLVVTSPGFPPTAPVLAAAADAGVPIWGDVELAWRLDASGHFGPPRRWLVVTGTNGKTTTTSMLHAMLAAAGRRALLCGNIGNPVIDVLGRAGRRCWPSSCPASSCTGRRRCSRRPAWCSTSPRTTSTGTARLAAYASDKARVLDGRVAVVGLDDPVAAGLLDTAAAPVRVGFRLGEPAAGELGVRDGVLVDNAFGDGVALADAASIPVAGPVGVLDALAAAALARAVDVPPEAIADALAGFQVGRTAPRWSRVDDGVTYVDDSKATNPHAAQASIAAYPRVVWIAGGLLKGASVDELVTRVANRLVGSGADRPRSTADCQRVIATRPGCPRRRACDGGGFWGAWDN